MNSYDKFEIFYSLKSNQSFFRVDCYMHKLIILNQIQQR